MKLNNLLEDRTDDLKQATGDWLSILLNSSRGCQSDPVEVLHGEGRAAIRYWDKWEADYGDEDEEDNDQEVLAKSAIAKLEKVIVDLMKRHPKMKFTYTTGEKNWIYLHVKPR
jgi:hypothetical protein